MTKSKKTPSGILEEIYIKASTSLNETVVNNDDMRWNVYNRRKLRLCGVKSDWEVCKTRDCL
jgi:hypothetical protein